MKQPKFLKSGDTVGICAPSFGAAEIPYRLRLESAVKHFQKRGYHVVLSPSAKKNNGLASADAKTRATEFTDLYLNCDAVFSAGGGEVMMEILPYLDFARLKAASPKFFVGYSDNTVLTYTLATLCDTIALYDYCAPTFGMTEWDKSLTDAFAFLTGEKTAFAGYPLYEAESVRGDEETSLNGFSLTEPSRWKHTHNLSVRGRILGGCLDVLRLLPGTPYDKTREFTETYRKDGILWTLENCELAPLDVIRTLWQLKQAGWFRNVKAFLFGRSLQRAEQFDLDFVRAAEYALQEFDVPKIFDADFGHLPPSLPIATGSLADVCVCDGKGTLRYLWD